MKRVLVMIILLLLVATAANLMILLGLWWLGERPLLSTGVIPNYGVVEITPQDVALWRDRREPDWPLEPSVACMQEYFGITHRLTMQAESKLTGAIEDNTLKIVGADVYSIDIVEFGWPMRCTVAEQGNKRNVVLAPNPASGASLVVFGSPRPSRVLWFGMVINESFYALLVGGIFCAWRYGRRWFRRGLGYCPLCAYDLSGNISAGCPECGWRRAEVSA